ncbi:P2 family phage major capsid protein [Symbiopectobacterium sp. RP]|uniref:P2 family phage major capsid protein n=1 Tax=Symbiopectobacterium sp. RP TaxID=3248553 RepID=UPI003D2C4D99
MDFAARIRTLIQRNRQLANGASPKDRILIEQENNKLEAELHGRNDGGHSGQWFSVGGESDTSEPDIFLPGSSGGNDVLPPPVMLTGEKPRAVATVITRVVEALTGEKSGAINFTSGSVSVNYSDVGPSPVQSGALAANYSAEFLTRINVLPVKAVEGESVMVGSGGPLAYVNNRAERRNPQAGAVMTPHRYQCRKVNFDTFINHDDLDAWAHLENYPELAKAAVDQRRNLDRLLIGFNGTHYSSPSNPETYPERHDCGVGWLEGSARTLAKDEPEYNRLSVYESWNEAYMVERYEAGCLIDGIVWKK